MIDFSQLTQSQQVLATLQSRYGTMQPGKLQMNRKQFWSYVEYPAAGAPELNFFGNALNGNNNLQRTNMPVQGSFGTSSFLIKQCSLDYYLANNKVPDYNGNDNSALYSEIVGGLFQAGAFTLTVNAKDYIQVNRPFLMLPPADGRMEVYAAGELTSAGEGPFPWADLARRQTSKWLVDPEILIVAQQNFSAALKYPSGVIPRILSGSFSTLYVGCVLDGIEIRPVQ
jgi:hypothetical protein